MNILYHHRIASKDGQFVHVEELTNALIEQGHELSFVAPGFVEKSDFGHDGGIATKLKKVLPKFIYEILELSYSLFIGYKLVKQILHNRPDFIYERYNLYQPIGVIVANIFKIPLLLEVNAPLADERKQHSGLSLYRFAKMIESYTWRNSNSVLPVSQVLADIVCESGVKPENIHVIHNGINDHLLNGFFESDKSCNDNMLTIGFVGFINKWHRLDLAINAISNFPEKNIRLICVGDGDIKSLLEQQSKRLNLENKVIFTGLKDRKEVFDFVKNFDIALQPSVTSYASPLKLFEYLSAGCLVIAPNKKNICEVINNNNSILFEDDNFTDFSEKLNFAIENFNDLEWMRENAKNVINSGNYTWQKNAKKVIEIASTNISCSMKK